MLARRPSRLGQREKHGVAPAALRSSGNFVPSSRQPSRRSAACMRAAVKLKHKVVRRTEGKAHYLNHHSAATRAVLLQEPALLPRKNSLRARISSSRYLGQYASSRIQRRTSCGLLSLTNSKVFYRCAQPETI